MPVSGLATACSSIWSPLPNPISNHTEDTGGLNKWRGSKGATGRGNSPFFDLGFEESSFARAQRASLGASVKMDAPAFTVIFLPPGMFFFPGIFLFQAWWNLAGRQNADSSGSGKAAFKITHQICAFPGESAIIFRCATEMAISRCAGINGLV